MTVLPKSWLTLPGVLLLLAGCNNTPQSLNSNGSPPIHSPTISAAPPTVERSPASSSLTISPEPTVAANRLISNEGIGIAKLGMTLGELKQELGAEATFTVQSSFMVDFDAIAVTESNEVKYYILYLSGQPFTDDDVIQGLLTDHPDFRTDAQVGPGTLIKQAEDAYGKATLSYNIANESREYVRFERQPNANISFATGNANQGTAGIYPSSTGEYNETQDFKADAKIQSVLIVCLSEECN